MICIMEKRLMTCGHWALILCGQLLYVYQGYLISMGCKNRKTKCTVDTFHSLGFSWCICLRNMIPMVRKPVFGDFWPVKAQMSFCILKEMCVFSVKSLGFTDAPIRQWRLIRLHWATGMIKQVFSWSDQGEWMHIQGNLPRIWITVNHLRPAPGEQILLFKKNPHYWRRSNAQEAIFYFWLSPFDK